MPTNYNDFRVRQSTKSAHRNLIQVSSLNIPSAQRGQRKHFTATQKTLKTKRLCPLLKMDFSKPTEFLLTAE
jgi:hypothetical protein